MEESDEDQNEMPKPKSPEKPLGFDLDGVIEKLWQIKCKPPGTFVKLDMKTEITPLLDKALEIIQQQPMLLRLKAPLVVGTDIHG